MNIQRHILFLSPGFPKDEDDFNTIPPLQEFIIKFKKVHPLTKISVISFQYPYHQAEYLWNGIDIFSLRGKNSKIKKPLVWLKAIQEAKKIHGSIKVDAVHSLWAGECAMIGNFLSQKINCTHICTLMGQDVVTSNNYLKWLKNSKTKFIALSKNQKDLFYKLTGKNVSATIHWGIDDQQINSHERDIELLGVGSLIPLKNYSLFIKTVEAIVKGKPDLSCKLVGTGPESTKLKEMAEAKGITKNIEFTGSLDRKEIFRLMQRSKILVHPSRFEGSGFVFAEALANGMNIVSFDVGYAQEHTKWTIAKNEMEFINHSEKLLYDKLNFNPINLFPLVQTVDRYAVLYGIS
ncbi:MAG TPA: glycosyltransferase, partial [Ignavibacteriaceae bacterium]